MRLFRSLLGLFFRLLYHPFAWTYDFVAAVVSLGRWQAWMNSVLPYMHGRVLEVGFGPGHLQLSLHARGFLAFGLDESRQMSRQAATRLRRQGYQFNLARGYAQQLPFPNSSFDTVVATFPSEYIFEAPTLAEIRRVLAAGGTLVVLPSAWITGRGPLERLAAGLFRVTGQAGAVDIVIHGVETHLRAAGFEVQHALVETVASRVLVFVAKRA